MSVHTRARLTKFRLMLALAAITPGLLCGQASGQSDIDERSQEIIAACIEAMGGEMALYGIESLEIRGTARYAAADLSPIVIRIKGPEKIWTQYANGNLVHVINGDVGWFVARGKASMLHNANFQALKQRELPLPHAFLAWLEYDGSIRFAGEHQINDAPAWKLEFAYASGGGFTAYFDQESGLLVRSDKGQQLTEYGFQKVDDIQILSRVVIRTGMNHQVIEFTEFDFSAEIPDRLFEIPAEISEAIAAQKKEADR